jgi:hypothetical protein
VAQAQAMIQTSFNGCATRGKVADVKLQNGNSIDFIGFAVDVESGGWCEDYGCGEGVGWLGYGEEYEGGRKAREDRVWL